MIKIKDIKPNPGNPRVIRGARLEKLMNSILNFPKMMKIRPIVMDGDISLGGNMRTKALEEICKLSAEEVEARITDQAKEDNPGILGYWAKIIKQKAIPNAWVRKVEDLTDKEKERFIITDNVGFGDWDWEALTSGWDADAIGEWGLDVPAWREEDGYYDVSGGIEVEPIDEDLAPRPTDDDYSTFELIMLHENKLKLLDVLNQVKQEFLFEKQEDALMEIIRKYESK